MPGYGLRLHTHPTLTGLLSAAVILTSAPTASAQLDLYSTASFSPLHKARIESLDTLDPVEMRGNQALNATIASNPGLAIPAQSFSLPKAGADALAGVSALDCMTAAIYYEATSEPITGQRAVAQVILNRVRHPAFPNTVCGVVFQGSARATGCQFTFTCDGSLARRPNLALWERARAIASASLGGFVETSVGHATHYHASYVQPYWAPNLTKLAAIGSHIFYQWKGRGSDPSSYTARYAGTEVMPLGARSMLNGYLISSAPADSGSAQFDAPQTAGHDNRAASSRAPQAGAPDIQREGLGDGVPSVTSLNVAKSELIESRARLKESTAPTLERPAENVNLSIERTR